VQRNDKQKLLKGVILAATLAMLPIGANAAGMGKITVLSALGQPLRAELDVTASREELASIAARVAPIEAFRQANVEYATVLSSIQFTLDKRPNGQAYFKIQTDRPVSDPFIDFLVELSWSSGRLVREYAFLLDPPEREGTVAGNVSPFVPVPEVASPPTEEAVAEMSSQVEKLAPPAPAARQPVAIAESDEERSRTVKSGDTLTKIAKENMADGVSLDQMLVLLFNSNRDAFDGANMNRLRAGKILSIPEPAEIAATVVSASEAKKTVIAQSSDFNAYRNRLADAAANQEVEADVSHQSSVGKVSPKVEEKQLVVSGQDKLQVSRNEQGATKGKASEEDLVAREKALKEANSRVAELEKNLSDLKKLAELKAQQAPVAAVETGPGKGIALPVETPPATDTSISAVAALPPDAVPVCNCCRTGGAQEKAESEKACCRASTAANFHGAIFPVYLWRWTGHCCYFGLSRFSYMEAQAGRGCGNWYHCK
jgi:pilus assembly protein FimV